MVQKMINDKKKKIVVLHVLNKMDRATEMLIISCTQNRQKNTFLNFFEEESEPGHFDEEILKLGGEIYMIDLMVSIFSYKNNCYLFYLNTKIDINMHTKVARRL